MSVLLRRWHTETLTEEVIPLVTTYLHCARCGRMAPAHLAERDPFTREFVHAGNCPYIRRTEVAAPAAPQPSRAQQMREEAAARQKHLRQMRTPAVAPPAPTPEQVRWIHEQSRQRAAQRQAGAATVARNHAVGR